MRCYMSYVMLASAAEYAMVDERIGFDTIGSWDT